MDTPPGNLQIRKFAARSGSFFTDGVIVQDCVPLRVGQADRIAG